MAGASVYRVLASIKNAPPDLQHVIILAMAGSREGKKIIFDKVRKGELFARILAEPKIEERFMVNITPAELSQYKKLTSDLAELSKEKTTLIRTRIADYFNKRPAPSVEQGLVVFVKNCSPCHSMKGEGGKIGPQLDGVGKWGVHSLSEKILDPNRNISENFRNYTIKLKDGKIISGLFRREEGEVEIFADATGKEFALPKKEIRERKPSKYTLMPDQFANTINQDDFNALIAYLIAQK
jgi:putative heme-binding domain-containing protein